MLQLERFGLTLKNVTPPPPGIKLVIAWVRCKAMGGLMANPNLAGAVRAAGARGACCKQLLASSLERASSTTVQNLMRLTSRTLRKERGVNN